MPTQLKPICSLFDFGKGRVWTLMLIGFFITFSGCLQNDNYSISLEDVVADSEAINQEMSKDRELQMAPDQPSPTPAVKNLLQDGHGGMREVDESDPAVVCLRFMEELHAGNRIGAENFLTRVALAVISREQIDLSPIGSERSQFEIVNLRYASIKQEVAYVEIRVVDGDQLDETSTWLLKLQNKKWRISGMIQNSNKGIPKMISFENLEDVAELQQ